VAASTLEDGGNSIVKRFALCSVFCFAVCLFAQAPGQYSGTWKSSATGSGGKLMLSFTETALGAASFSYQDQNVKSKPVSLKKDSDHVDLVFEYSLDGNPLRSRMQGTVSQTAIKGKYQSTTADGSPVDEGTWEVTQQQ